jgi:hypothetical protein
MGLAPGAADDLDARVDGTRFDDSGQRNPVRGRGFIKVDDQRRAWRDNADEGRHVEDVIRLTDQAEATDDRHRGGWNADLFLEFTQCGPGEVATVLVVDRAARKPDLAGVPAEMLGALDEHDVVWRVSVDG